MLRNKDIKRIDEIQTDFHEGQLSLDKLFDSFKALKLTGRFSEFNHLKTKGYSFKLVLSSLIMMVVSPAKTVSSSLQTLSGLGMQAGKDVFYRLKNNERICWRAILWYLALKFVRVTQDNDTSSGERKPHYLIFDDTTVEKSGRKMEFLGRVWDHVTQKSILGFKILVMLYWDGKSSIPLDFSIHREKGKKSDKPFGMKKSDLRKQYSKKRVKESESAPRIKELDTSKTESMIKMFYSAVYRCLQIDYVLVDSWFTCDTLIKAVVASGMHLIGMYKIATTKFLYRYQYLTCNQIRDSIKEVKRCKHMNLYYKCAPVEHGGIRMTLFFSRQGKHGKWKVILTTDTELSFIQAVRHYQARWIIEVFNKEAKGMLNLGGCRSSNFDAQIADTTVTMIAYILLSFRYRYDHYETLGALFRCVNDEWLRITLDERLWEIFLELVALFASSFGVDAEELLGIILTNPQTDNILGKMWLNNEMLTG